MHYLSDQFESQKNKKAAAYTIFICGTIFLLFILIHWKTEAPSLPVVQDLIEINLGNNEEGWGEEQPLIKGERSPNPEPVAAAKPAAAARVEDERVNPADDAEADAAPVNKPVKNVTRPTVKTDNTPANPAPKPQKPRLTYNGPGNAGGNNPTDDNGYRYQGNKPGGRGDAGDPNGNKDSYGNSPGGRIGNGPRVTKGNRSILSFPNFTDELGKATIFAVIKVSPSGQGSFIGFDKGSTSRSDAYANAIRRYLTSIRFNKDQEESFVTVRFNFNVQ